MQIAFFNFRSRFIFSRLFRFSVQIAIYSNSNSKYIFLFRFRFRCRFRSRSACTRRFGSGSGSRPSWWRSPCRSSGAVELQRTRNALATQSCALWARKRCATYKHRYIKCLIFIILSPFLQKSCKNQNNILEIHNMSAGRGVYCPGKKSKNNK